MANDLIARCTKTRLRRPPSNSWMSTSSRLSLRRRWEAAVSTCRAARVNGLSSALVLWRSQDNPTSAASVTSPTATTFPAGPSFAGRARLTAVKAPCLRGANSWPLSNEAPHHPQKRFSGGLAWRHRGHGVCSATVAHPPFPYSTTLATLYQPQTRLILAGLSSATGSAGDIVDDVHTSSSRATEQGGARRRVSAELCAVGTPRRPGRVG